MMIESEADERLKSLFELSRLYDIYGGLLNDHSRKIFEDHVLNDLSLAEIAAEVGLSRQGVRDVIVRCSKKLYEYEDCLGLLKKLDQTDAALAQVSEALSGNADIDRALELIGRIRTELGS